MAHAAALSGAAGAPERAVEARADALSASDGDAVAHIDPAHATAAAASNPQDRSAPPLDRALLLRERVRETFAFNRTSLAGHAIGAVLVEVVYATAAPLSLRVGWGALFALVWLARAALALRYAQVTAAGAGALALRLRAWQAGVLASGALWGVAAWCFSAYGGGLHQLALVLVVYTFCVACVPILAPQFVLFVVFVVLVFAPAIVRVALLDATLRWQVALVMLVAMAMTILLGRNYRASFERIVGLKLRTEALAAQLRVEKADADAARADAEVANRAKTQFFAAASHDLRQPLHAMGLFAEALRSRSRDPDAAQLVASIHESVDALEGLFSELLDITRIDNGGVEVRPVDFELAEVLRKLRIHFEPAAFEKGLALRIRGGRRVAFADPLLVERVVRNLVSNAIRYTVDGAVLVSCRARGQKLLVQVWDTGPGIAPDECARVFDEFYQVPGTEAHGAEQKKGLGLGLAIVKRLAALMQAPLTLRSVVGHGTVFTLTLPLGKPPRPTEPATTAAPPPVITLAGRTIVVVDDEPAVRDALEAVLRTWGADTVVVASAAAARAWAESTDGAAAPALVIADYHLEDGATGLDAIGAIRRRFGRDVPAIVVSGSNLVDHERDAVAQDAHVLMKPVLPNRLRAMIAFKLDGR